MTLFRAGDDDAFSVIHDRYRGLLLTYVRHVLGASHADAEDVLQDVLVRAYRGLRAHDRTLNLSPWLYRVARNACIDELRRRVPVPHAELPHDTRALDPDPVHAESIRRERVSRLLSDLQQLPEQQRSALLLCELSGLSYADVADALGTSVSAVKSLLVRARLGLVQSLEARETACSEIRDELAGAHARGQRPNVLARRHVHDCQGCRKYDLAMRDRKRELAALTPTVAPLAVLAKLFGGGAGSGASATAAGGAGGTSAASGGVAVSAGMLGANAAHVLTVLAATTIVAAGAVGIKEATATHALASPSTPVHAPYAPAVPAGPAAANVPGSLRGAAAARAASHHAAPASSTPALGNGRTSPSGAAAPVVTPGSPTAPAAPAPTSAPTTSKSSSSSCPIGQQSCAAGSHVTSTTDPGSSTTSTSSQLPLGSGGSSMSTGDRPAHVTNTPIGGGSSAGATPPTSSSSESSQPLGSSTSPPLGS